jgi:hypothetical protein
MSLTTHEARHWHAIYRELSPRDQRMIDEAYDAVVKVCKEFHPNTWSPAGDDRAEELAAAITQFYVVSKDRT